MKCKLTKEKCPFPSTFWETGRDCRSAASDNCPIGKYKDSDFWALNIKGPLPLEIIWVIDDCCRYYGVTKRFKDNYIRD